MSFTSHKYTALVAKGRHFSSDEAEISLGSQDSAASQDACASTSSQNGSEYTTANSVWLGENSGDTARDSSGRVGAGDSTEPESASSPQPLAAGVEVAAVVEVAVVTARATGKGGKRPKTARGAPGRCRAGCGACVRAKAPPQAQPYFKVELLRTSS